MFKNCSEIAQAHLERQRHAKTKKHGDPSKPPPTPYRSPEAIRQAAKGLHQPRSAK